jgi:hemerythrin superfamily protein
MFAALEKEKGDVSAVLAQLANDLTAHMAIEQTIFYPAVREIDPETVGESYQEHAIAELALKRLLDTTTDDSTFAAKVTTLRELVLHHVEEEEEQLFSAVEKKWNADRLEALGVRMERAFEEASKQGYESLLPQGLATSADRDQTPLPPRLRRTKRARSRTGRVTP